MTEPAAIVPWIDALLPRETRVSDDGASPVDRWEIPQTIGELSYLTHNYYRYFGKFPPTIPRKLLRAYRPPAGQWVLDNFAGSGTTLVEARCEGVPSIGVDIGPLAALAARVKTEHVEPAAILEMLAKVGAALRARAKPRASRPLRAKIPLPPPDVLEKWFLPETTAELSCLRLALAALPLGPERRLLVLAFFAIVRRVSLAHDSEVRPHIKPGKKPRGVLATFEKKVVEMALRMEHLRKESDPDAPALVVCGDSRRLTSLVDFSARPVGLVIAHPPYLNCFSYLPAFKLEYFWAKGFDELGVDLDWRALTPGELPCWPATNARVFSAYFGGLEAAFAEVARVLAPGARCCVVLGDCTVRGELVLVLDRFVDLMTALGYRLERTILRSTHYGIGKYAYMGRADYHGAGARKRDGILVFERG